MTPTIREEILEPLRRSLRWLAGLRGSDGVLVCPDHRVEHTGKNAGAIVTACELLAHDPRRDERFLRELAVGQARRLVANLVREGTSACHTFRPGRHDPFNCSNSVIDGGACSDALAHLVHAGRDWLGPADRDAFAASSLLHARTYLRYAVLDKGIPAQRAWGLTGLASAHSLEADVELEKAALEAVGVLEGIQHEDGSFPYHPIEWGGSHPGSADVSAFYQSRVSGFLVFALERLGRDPRDPLFAGPIARGLDFLWALQAPDGIKCGLVEAKPWYWGAEYEVASHAFDVHAFACGHRLFRRERFALAAQRSFRAWVAHLTPEGQPRSHLPGRGRGESYQCPVFWAGHAMWIARALPDLERAFAVGEPAPRAHGTIDLSVAWFPDAALARLEDASVVAWVRGARPAVNVHHGSPHGAGLVRVFGKREGRDLLERCRLGGANEGEWNGAAGSWSLRRAWGANEDEMRFSLWLARVAFRRHGVLAAAKAPLSVFARGPLAFARPRVSSAFALAPKVDVRGDGVVLRSQLARRDGEVVAGSALERSFSLDGDGLCVEEHLASSGGATVAYRVPSAAHDVERSAARVSYRLGS